MVVKLRFKQSPRKRGSEAPLRAAALERPREAEIVSADEIAAGAASLLWPVTAMVFALAIWRLGQDLGLTASFFIEDGPLSHWQVWLALAVTLGAACVWLSRRGKPDDDSPAIG